MYLYYLLNTGHTAFIGFTSYTFYYSIPGSPGSYPAFFVLSALGLSTHHQEVEEFDMFIVQTR